jgi:exopolysaccharide biosynthesis polyprenyl glycosylphosphotransferase
MLSRRSESSRIATFVLDQVLLGCAFAAALALREALAPSGLLPGRLLDAESWTRLYLVCVPLVALALWAGGLYRSGIEPIWTLGGKREALWGGLLAFVVLEGVGALLGSPGGAGTARALPFLFLPLAAAALLASRLLLAAAGRRLRDAPGREMRVLVFGLSPRTLRLLDALRRAPSSPLRVLGVSSEAVPADLGPRLPRDRALALLQQGRVDQVLVDAERVSPEELQLILARADREGLSVHITSAMFPSTSLLPAWERIDGVPVLGFVAAELPLGARLAKRSFDLAVAATGLLLLAPALLAIAAAIRLGSPGPAFHVQRRVGARGRTFPLVKFRTMAADAEAATGPVFAVKDDPRCTPIGRVLRRTNLDELPQLLNVLAGHMSLVGPRPERPEFVERFKGAVPRYAHKHWVRPGITGWAQVHGLRGAATSLPDRVEHDLYYIENWSLMLDIRILVRTVFDGYLNAA